MIQKVQFAGIFHKYVVTRAGIRIKKWRWSSNAPNWTFNGQKQPQWGKISKKILLICNPLRILSDICVTAKKLRRRFKGRLHEFWKFDMFWETFRLIACAISNLVKRPYKNVWVCFSFFVLYKNSIIKNSVLYQRISVLKKPFMDL